MESSLSAAVTTAVPQPTTALAILAGQVDDDVYAANLRQDAATSRGTRTANTERALLGDVLLFSAWCTDAGLRHMPATAETVAAFMACAAERNRKPA